MTMSRSFPGEPKFDQGLRDTLETQPVCLRVVLEDIGGLCGRVGIDAVVESIYDLMAQGTVHYTNELRLRSSVGMPNFCAAVSALLPSTRDCSLS